MLQTNVSQSLSIGYGSICNWIMFNFYYYYKEINLKKTNTKTK